MYDDLYEMLIHLMDGDNKQAETCFSAYVQIKTSQLLEGGRFLSKEEADQLMKDASEDEENDEWERGQEYDPDSRSMVNYSRKKVKNDSHQWTENEIDTLAWDLVQHRATFLDENNDWYIKQMQWNPKENRYYIRLHPANNLKTVEPVAFDVTIDFGGQYPSITGVMPAESISHYPIVVAHTTDGNQYVIEAKDPSYKDLKDDPDLVAKKAKKEIEQAKQKTKEKETKK